MSRRRGASGPTRLEPNTNRSGGTLDVQGHKAEAGVVRHHGYPAASCHYCLGHLRVRNLKHRVITEAGRVERRIQKGPRPQVGSEQNKLADGQVGD